MRIEKIGNDKIKVTLSSLDLLNFDVDMSDLYPESEELHSFLFRIMETIREETGFNPFGGQVVVEATPMKDGICIVVSKPKVLKQYMQKKGAKRNIHIKARAKQPSDLCIFYFQSFDDLCGALKILAAVEISKLALYRLGSAYCVAMNRLEVSGQTIAVMTEYCIKIPQKRQSAEHVREHWKLIAEGEKLTEMAEQIKTLT